MSAAEIVLAVVWLCVTFLIVDRAALLAPGESVWFMILAAALWPVWVIAMAVQRARRK